jgi:hypothetical protein
MCEAIEKFSTEIQQLSNHFNELDFVACFVAGAAKQNLRFDISLDVILRFLAEVVEAFNKGDITAEQRMEIEYSTYKGVIGEAKQKLISYTTIIVPPQAKNRGSQLQFIESNLQQRGPFSEVKELNSGAFYRNPSSSEVVSLAEAQRIERANSELIRRIYEVELAESQRLVDDDERLARALQDELNHEERPAVKDKEATCQICLETIPEDEYMPLENCGDLFHLQCMSRYLTTLINDRQFPLVCPLPECRQEINMIDISERIEPSELAKFEEFTFNHFVQRHMDDMTCCPTADCGYVFTWLGDISMFVCPVCKQEYCLTCKCIYHRGKSCEEYQRDKKDEPLDRAFMEFARGAKYKMCSRCKFWVEKSDGCDHMTCRCGYEFCYVCGGVYMQCECQGAPMIEVMPMPMSVPRAPHIGNRRGRYRGSA